MKCPCCAADYQFGEVKCSYCRSALPQPVQAAAQAPQPIQIINYNFAPPMPAQAPPVYFHDHRQAARPMVSPRNRGMALLLCLFGGYLGIHYFYVGRVGKGIVYLFTCGLFVFGWMIDILKVTFGTFRDGDGLPLKW